MDRQPVLEGERLYLRPLKADDWDALFAVASDPQVWAKHPAHDRWQEPVFREFFADALAHQGALVVVDKASGEIVGSSRFQGYDPADGGSVEIGWTFLAHRLWGRGYNAEMKRLMLEHALRSVERVLFRVGEDNVVSRGAMANIGGHLTDRTDVTDLAGVPVTHVVYEITRESFARGPLARAQ
jgi:RimJ/RimL family protein N-acetyltransferase